MSPSFFQQLKTVPVLGFGLGHKDEYCDDLVSLRSNLGQDFRVDWLEIIPENYMGKGGFAMAALQRLKAAGYPMVSHGVNLSLGSVDELNPAYLNNLEQLFEIVQPHWFSDHLSFGSVNNGYFNDLMPLPFTREAIAVCVRKIKRLQQRFSVPFLIENASYYTHFAPEADLDEAGFISEILEQADCGLLLDVNNVFVNAQNHHYDPIAFLQKLPLEGVVEIHIAGHLETDTLIIDTHGAPVRTEVFDLLRWAYPRCPNLKGVLLERDTNLPPFETLVEELQVVREASQTIPQTQNA